MKGFIRLTLGLVALAPLVDGVPTAAAEQKILLRVADSLPATHQVVKFATKYFMEAVAKQYGDGVSFEYYGSEQLGKARDLLQLTVSGAADVGYVAPSYVSDKMPLSEVGVLPGLFTSSCAGSRAFYKVAMDGMLGKADFTGNGVRIVVSILQPPNQLFLTKHSPADIKVVEGLKVRSSGGAQDTIIKSMKGVPVQIAGPEIYQALSRGTVDGMIVSFAAMLSYSWIDVVKNSTIDESFGSFIFTYVIGENRWKQLPDRLRQVITKVGVEASERGCAGMEKELTPIIKTLNEKGLRAVKVNPDSKKALAAALDSVSADWAAGLDKRGKPGSQVLKEFRATLSAAK